MSRLLGRTNLEFPRLWLSLMPPHQISEGWLPQFVQHAVAQKTVLDISSRPGLWGGAMRGTDALLMARGGLSLENATDSDHASDLLQAELLQILCSVGREHLDFFFLDYRKAWEEHQIVGALQTLEFAKQHGTIRHIGLYFGGSFLAAMAMWQFNDAFEVVLSPSNPICQQDFQAVTRLAHDRRVGVVQTHLLNWRAGKPFFDGDDDPDGFARGTVNAAFEHGTALVGVRSIHEINNLAHPGGQNATDAQIQRYQQWLDEKAYAPQIS